MLIHTQSSPCIISCVVEVEAAHCIGDVAKGHFLLVRSSTSPCEVSGIVGRAGGEYYDFEGRRLNNIILGQCGGDKGGQGRQGRSELHGV